MAIHISSPCYENWERMQVVQDGRHCEVCNKTVHDFRSYEPSALQAYLQAHQGEKICGRFNKEQVTEGIIIRVPIQAIYSFNHRQQILFAFLFAFFNLLSCTGPDQQQSKIKAVEIISREEKPFANYMGGFISAPADSPEASKSKNKLLKPKTEELIPHIMGEVEEMPEYFLPEKTDTLNDMLAKELQNPDSLTNGRVTVAFSVDDQGQVQHIHILESLSHLHDAEAIRAVGLLSGQAHGLQPGRYKLPIEFKSKPGIEAK